MLTPQMRADARALFEQEGYTGKVDDNKIISSLGTFLSETRRHRTDPTSNLHVPVHAAFGK